MIKGHRQAAVLLVIGAVGCGDAEPEQIDLGQFRFQQENAQVTIVSDSAIAAAPAWSPIDTLIIGSQEGAGAFQRVTFAFRLPDGRYLGADGMAASILVFDSDGNYLESWGRRGAGPGEFQGPGWIGVCDSTATTVTIFDWYRHILSTLTTDDGSLIYSWRIPGGVREPPSCNRSGDVSIVAKLQRPPVVSEGLYRPTVTISVAKLPDPSVRDLLMIPGADHYRFARQDGPIGDFGRKPHVVLGDSTLYVATGDAFEIAEFSLSGELVRIIRAPGIPRERVTDEDLEDALARQLARQPQRYHAKLRRDMNEMEWPLYHPTVTSILTDTLGCIWVQKSIARSPDANWRVLSSSGELVASMQLPSQLTVTHITHDQVIGYVLEPQSGGLIKAFDFIRSGNPACSRS